MPDGDFASRDMVYFSQNSRRLCFLLDDRSSYITGSVLAVNGGIEM